MALFAQTNNPPLPSGKDLVLLCMDYRYYDHDDAMNTKFKLGEKMIWIGCPNCKQEATHKYSKEFSVKVDSPTLQSILFHLLDPTII